MLKISIRIINHEVYDAHTEPIFKEFELLTFHQVYLFHLGKFMFMYHKQRLPHNFNTFFIELMKFMRIIRGL
jgi:hypothetical protein